MASGDRPLERRAPLRGGSVAALKDWASLWADLLHVEMALHERAKLSSDLRHVFARRGLWEGAVIAYGRTAVRGRRQKLIGELIAELGPEARACHDEVIRWRHKHVAHRGDATRERVGVDGVSDSEGDRLTAVRIRVALAVGPESEDEGLPERFEAHVYELRNLVWEERIRPLEATLLEEYGDTVRALPADADRPTADRKRLVIEIDPSGEQP